MRARRGGKASGIYNQGASEGPCGLIGFKIGCGHDFGEPAIATYTMWGVLSILGNGE